VENPFTKWESRFPGRLETDRHFHPFLATNTPFRPRLGRTLDGTGLAQSLGVFEHASD